MKHSPPSSLEASVDGEETSVPAPTRTAATQKPKLLIVDDDEEIRTQMRWALAADYSVVMAGDRAAALEQFRSHRPSVVLLDLGLPPNPGTPEEGLAALSEILATDRLAKVVIVSGQGEKGPALRAIGAGAYDFVGKPVEMDELKLLLKRCFHLAQLEREYYQMQQTLRSDSFEGLLGTGPRMQVVFDAIRKVATTDAPVLILGESGTGKEMTARAIHQRSARKNGPFVAINCSAIPETLIESELFGHEKGAFTGAHAQRKGRIEHSSGGTLFLDEIGDMPMAMQVKLLRFLQERRIRRVGGNTEIPIDVRVLAATHQDLEDLARSGRFREDLYYRVHVIEVRMPPLRERIEDIPQLTQLFVARHAERMGRPAPALDPAFVAALARYSWPGNIRELENVAERSVALTSGDRLTADILPQEITGAMPAVHAGKVAIPEGFDLEKHLDDERQRFMAAALDVTGGVQKRAAEALGMTFRSFRYFAKKFTLVDRGEDQDDGDADVDLEDSPTGPRRNGSRPPR